MDPTPYVVISVVILVALWRFGVFNVITNRLRGNPQPRSVVQSPTPMSSRASVADREIAPEELASRYGTYLLGLAFQVSVKRDAEYNLMHEAATKSADAARTAWQAPFGGSPTPGPPQGGPGMPNQGGSRPAGS